MDVTVLIPTLASEKTKPYVEACVRSLRETTPWYEIIVATNGENTQELEVDARVIHRRKKGQCGAVNKVLELVETRYVLVSNDDMIYSPNWDGSLEVAVKKYRCVSPTLVESLPGAPPFYVYNCGRTIEEFKKSEWLSYVAQMRTGAPCKKMEIEDGFNLPFLTRTDIFRTIEGYDESYDPGGSNSDPDVMFKMMLAGIAPKRDRLSLVYHFSLQSGSMADDRQSWWHNWRYFPQKWGFERPGTNEVWYAGGEDGIRIPTPERPYVAEVAHGHGIHPGKDWLEYHPSWEGQYGKPFYGKGKYYDQ